MMAASSGHVAAPALALITCKQHSAQLAISCLVVSEFRAVIIRADAGRYLALRFAVAVGADVWMGPETASSVIDFVRARGRREMASLFTISTFSRSDQSTLFLYRLQYKHCES